jgi:hypothetical protein
LFEAIENVDLEYQNSMVKITALGSLQELSVAQTKVGPLVEGKEYEMRFWIAQELVKAGYARFYDDVSMKLSSLNRIHWMETKLQSGIQISPIPDYFYPKLRRYLSELKKGLASDASLAGEYSKASRLAQDIVNCRLKKIVNLATYSLTESILKSLSREERSMFDSVTAMVSEWGSKVLKIEVSK